MEIVQYFYIFLLNIKYTARKVHMEREIKIWEKSNWGQQFTHKLLPTAICVQELGARNAVVTCKMCSIFSYYDSKISSFVLKHSSRQGTEINKLILNKSCYPQFVLYRQNYVIVFAEGNQSTINVWNLQTNTNQIYKIGHRISSKAIFQVFEQSGIICILDLKFQSLIQITALKINQDNQIIPHFKLKEDFQLKAAMPKIIKLDNISKLAIIDSQFNADSKQELNIQFFSIKIEQKQSDNGDMTDNKYEFKTKLHSLAITKYVIDKSWRVGYISDLKVSQMQEVNEHVLFLQIENKFKKFINGYYDSVTKQFSVSKICMYYPIKFIFVNNMVEEQFPKMKTPILFINYENGLQKLVGYHQLNPAKLSSYQQKHSQPEQQNYQIIYKISGSNLNVYTIKGKKMQIMAWSIFHWKLSNLCPAFFLCSILQDCDDDLIYKAISYLTNAQQTYYLSSLI